MQHRRLGSSDFPEKKGQIFEELPQTFLKPLPACGGLNLAGWQMPTKAALSLPLPYGTREKKM